MDEALSLEEFMAVEGARRVANCYEMFNFPTGGGKIYISNQFDLGASELFHYHDEPHLTLIVNGGVIDHRKSTEDERLPGELMFFHSGEIHRTVNKLFPTKYVTLTLDWDFLRQKSITEAKLDNLIKQNTNSKFTLLKIYKECSANDEFSDSSIEMLLFNLTDEKKIIKNTQPNWIKKVYELLNDNWNKELSLNDLAHSANVHPKTVSRYFPKYFACTLGEYRRKLKISKSLALIKNSKLSLTEIAHECNFADQSHFIRTFKDLTGFLPKQFQKL